MFLVIVWAIAGAVFCSFEIMCNKWLIIKRGVNGDISGMFFLLVEGFIGTVCLIITTLNGGGLYEISGYSFGMSLFAGFCGFIALVMMNYAAAIGLAGVAVAIFSANGALHVVVSYFFLHQIITQGQVIGVLVALAGGVLLSVADYLPKNCCGNKPDDDHDTMVKIEPEQQLMIDLKPSGH